ncbi:MAG: hypothetical protein KC646_06650 [Candidatus Cloacimonetes bacterium]|nr:hypothetical protein [Candidatus Cloacimonadota bacterium]
MKNSKLFYLVAIFILSFSSSAEVVFIERLDNSGNYRQIQNNSFSDKIPTQSTEMKSAIAGYELSQKIAFERSLVAKGIPTPSVKFLSSQKKTKPLYIEVDNGDWAYNLMNGKNIQIISDKGTKRVQGAPIIKFGRNIPNSGHKHFMGETCSHEIGHAVMNALYSGKNLPKNQGGEHTIDSIKSPSFAWIEGFAEYYAASTYGDKKFPRGYKDRNSAELNSSEGYIASVLLELDKNFSKEDIFNVIVDIKPQSPADFLEEYIARYPKRASTVFEIMKKYSNEEWPDETFITKYNQGSLPTLDLDGNGTGASFGKDSEIPSQSKKLAQKIDKTQKQMTEVSSYLARLSKFLDRIYSFKQNIYQNYSNSSFAKSYLNRAQAMIDRANHQFNSYQKYLVQLRQQEKQQINDFNDLQDFGSLSAPSYNSNDSNDSTNNNAGQVLRY